MTEAEHGQTKEALWVQIATQGISAAWTATQQSAGRSSCISWWVHQALQSVKTWHSCWFTQASWKGTRLHCLCCPVKMSNPNPCCYYQLELVSHCDLEETQLQVRFLYGNQRFALQSTLGTARPPWINVCGCTGQGWAVACACVPVCGSHVRMGALVLQWSGGASLHHLGWFSVPIVGHALPALVLHPPVPENCSGMCVSRASGYHWGCTGCCNGDEWKMLTLLIITL